MARQLGFAEDAAFFLKRSENWRNVFDASIGLVRGKDSNGKWREPYDPYTLGHGADKANDFTEGNAFQYTWHVMQNPQGLVDAMGGRDAFVKKLDSLFEAPSKTEGMGEVLDVTGLIGQYVQGNEPSHHVIYFYPQVGHPEKAAERVREVFDKFYLPKPDGLCGNDDCGQMSAWYVFSAMGFYPFNPCGGEYILGAPQVERVKIRVGEGKDKIQSPARTQNPGYFTVVARNLSRENKYVKSVTLNGKPITDWKISHSDIMSGGELVFEMYSGAKQAGELR
jgi:predicted alpha-1,2-mannosidase